MVKSYVLYSGQSAAKPRIEERSTTIPAAGVNIKRLDVEVEGTHWVMI